MVETEFLIQRWKNNCLGKRGLGLHENRVRFCNKCHEGNLSFLRAIKPFKLLVVMAYWAISYKKLLAIHERDVTPEQAAYPREWHTINMEITSAKWHCWSIVESRTSAHRRQILHHAASVRLQPGEHWGLPFSLRGGGEEIILILVSSFNLHPALSGYLFCYRMQSHAILCSSPHRLLFSFASNLF